MAAIRGAPIPSTSLIVIVVDHKRHRAGNVHDGGHTWQWEFVTCRMKEKPLIRERKQMRFEREQVTKVNEEAARQISTASDGFMVESNGNLQSFLADLQHQHPGN